jgi:plastocyanin
LLGSCIITGGLALFALSCSSPDPTETVPDTPGGTEFGAIDPANGSAECMGDDAGTLPFDDPGGLVSGFKDDGDPNSFVCTAKEVFIATADVIQVFDPAANGGAGAFVAFDPENPPHCNEGDDITFKMAAHVEQNAVSERQDIGIWIATDGGNAKTGDCNHYNLPDDATGTTNLDGDQCAGLAQGGTTVVDLGTLTVPCNPDPETSNLSVGSCIGWKVPADDAECSDDADGNNTSGQPTDFRAGTLPTNKSKCNCEPFVVPIIVDQSATIEVKKVCDPTTDTGTFDLLIDGSNAFGDEKACGGTTGTQTVSAGTSADPGADHTVGENDFTTADYTTTHACTRNGSNDATLAGSGTTIDPVHVEPDDAIVCTFTNVRKGGILIKKETNPDGATGTFSFTHNVGTSSDPTVTSPFTLSDGGSQAFSKVIPGTYTVTEADPAPAFDLESLDCDDDASATPSTTSGRVATIKVDPGETVTCTYTNKQRGSIIIKKETNPDGASGSFSFAHNVGSNSDPTVTTPFSLSDGGSQTFTNVKPGNYTVTESDPTPAFDLESLDCDDDASATPSTTAGLLATVKVDPGETVTCTYTNKQRATVTVNKRESGALPLTHAWSFEIRTGASTIAAGTVIATGSANTTTGVVTFACSPNPNAFCGNVSSIANIIPGNYQLCETGMPAGYSNNITGFTPLGAIPEGADNSTECINITLGAGGSGVPTGVPNPIDNTPPPGGDARTIGYWKNWSSCTGGKQYIKAVANGDISKTLDGRLPELIGDLNITTCAVGFDILNKSDIVSHKKKANDAAYGLAAQLLAAKFNVEAGAGTCAAATNAIAGAQALLDLINFTGTGNYLVKASANRTAALGFAATLDSYNNNTLCP